MNCQEIRERMPDLAAGLTAATSETEQHLSGCVDCTEKLNEFRQTMALLDAWEAPEPSPYFDVRLGARLREEMAKQPARGWLHWFRKPALALSFAAVLAVGISMFHGDGTIHNTAQDGVASVQPGTAVGDLQTLDKNEDLYANFEVLDDLQVQPDVTENP